MNRGREPMFTYAAEAGQTHSEVDDGRGAEGAGWGGDMEKI